MNRILFEPTEVRDRRVTFGGERAEHVLRVLHGEIGQTLKTGELDGLIGTSKIVDIRGNAVTCEVQHDQMPLPSWVDVILAPPRPRVMKRLLPQLATLGVGTLVLVGAHKVEKDFWGATLLKAENYRPLLVDGLMQGAVATEVPRIEPRRNLRKFIAEEMESCFPTASRIIAHPYAEGQSAAVAKVAPGERLLLAVGPEGGWTDEEVALLEARGFARYSLGHRILRTDTALIALLTRFNSEA